MQLGCKVTVIKLAVDVVVRAPIYHLITSTAVSNRKTGANAIAHLCKVTAARHATAALKTAENHPLPPQPKVTVQAPPALS